MAKSIESNYHILYKASDDWVQEQIKQAHIDGYVTVAFGMRVRTPVLKQVVYGSPKMPYEAASEARTAGNALGQSYGLLNNRAGIEFAERAKKSVHNYDIHPCMHIHDAQYFLVTNEAAPVKFLNDNLVECMQWQQLPELQHPTVKLGGDLDIFYPDWTIKHTLPHNISETELIKFCLEQQHV